MKPIYLNRDLFPPTLILQAFSWSALYRCSECVIRLVGANLLYNFHLATNGNSEFIHYSCIIES